MQESLIVEDDVRLAQALAHILAENGYQTDVVHDGAWLLAYAECGDYDVIILDVMLPKMDGFAVVAQLRRKDISDAGAAAHRARRQIRQDHRPRQRRADDYMTSRSRPPGCWLTCARSRARQGEVLFEKLAAATSC